MCVNATLTHRSRVPNLPGMKLNPTSYAIAQSLFLVVHPISVAAAAPPPPEPTDHLLVVDVSGSMYADLPKIRQQLKNKLPSLLAPGDTISIVWFSGRGECAVLVEALEVTLSTLAQLNKVVDHLVPRGLTGFKEPIEGATEVFARVQKAGKGRRTSFIFESDGCDNQWSRSEIMAAIDKLAPAVSSATVVEYGYYADKALLAKMAEKLGGALVLAQDFMAWEPVFDAAIQRKAGSSKKLSVKLGTEPVGGFAFAIDGEQVLPFETAPTREGASVTVPDHLSTLFYLSTERVGENAGPLGPLAAAWRDPREIDPISTPREPIAATYAAIHLFSQRVQPKVIWPILRALGDVHLIEAFSTCFGKQRYADFVALTGDAATGHPDGWFLKGYDPNRARREDAFTILDLFALLASDKRCRVLTESPEFRYSRIGRKAVSKDVMLTVTEAEHVAAAADEIKALTAGRDISSIKAAIAKIEAIFTSRPESLKFVLDEIEAAIGYSIDGLVWNSTMPNLSFRVRKAGFVDIAGTDAPADVQAALPATLPTHQFRAYTVVRDGLVHIEKLPVVVPREVADALTAAGVVPAWGQIDGDPYAVLDLKALPVINQKMIADASARDLAEKEWALIGLKAAAKVYEHFAPEKAQKTFTERFGEEATAWLKGQHVTEGGFSPETTAAPTTDVTYVTSLTVKIPGVSSLPKIDDTLVRMAEIEAERAKAPKKPKALTAGMKLLAPYLEGIQAFRTAHEGEDASLFAAWLAKKAADAVAAKRTLEAEIARLKWAVVVGGSYFREFTSLAENTLTVRLGGEDREVTFDLNDRTELKV